MPPFKKYNPGCPCCFSAPTVCACYSFDNTADNSVFDGLHLGATSPSYTAADKKLGTHAATFTGYAHYNHAHSECFSPAVGPKPWRVWFWFKMLARPSYSAQRYHGVITKGKVNGTGVTAAAPPTSFDGEWGVFYHAPFGDDSSPELFFVYQSDSVNLGIYFTTGVNLNNWYFFHWQINATTKAAEVFAVNADGTGSNFGNSNNIVGNMSADSSKPLRIGNNTGINGMVLGSNGGSFIIDNVGFAQNSGNASSLYNSGYGRACPAST